MAPRPFREDTGNPSASGSYRQRARFNARNYPQPDRVELTMSRGDAMAVSGSGC